MDKGNQIDLNKYENKYFAPDFYKNIEAFNSIKGSATYEEVSENVPFR